MIAGASPATGSAAAARRSVCRPKRRRESIVEFNHALIELSGT
jgi:hypothetical protein